MPQPSTTTFYERITFADISQVARVRGPPIVLRDPDGRPVEFEDPETGETFEGYDPTVTDKFGNRVGEPTGQTHAVLFFDYDDDRDPDLWVANDGDRLHLFRNDSSPGRVRFVPVASSMGIDKVGAWMGFAVGDYDGDSDLDVFASNMGFHPLLMEPRHEPSAICSYSMRFDWVHARTSYCATTLRGAHQEILSGSSPKWRHQRT